MEKTTRTRISKHAILADDTLPARPRDAAAVVAAAFKAWQARRLKQGTLSTELPPRRK